MILAVILVAAACGSVSTDTAPLASPGTQVPNVHQAPRTRNQLVPATGLLALRPGDATATETSDYGVVILNAWETERLAAIKIQSPATKVLVYKDMSSTRSYASSRGSDDERIPTGVGYAFADKAHPDWFLRDASGRRIEWKGYPRHWWMDVGNRSYAEVWIANVLAELHSTGWDGVFVDNAMYTADFYLPPGRRIARYPDDEAFSAATDSFLAAAGPSIQAAGFDFVPNFGGRFPDLDQYSTWVSYGTGALREYFGRFGGGGEGRAFSGEAWDHELRQQELVQAQGKAFYALAYGKANDDEFEHYVRASFLLGWNGTSGALLYSTPTPGEDPWRNAWTSDVGTPNGPREADGVAWRRTFTRGIVVVNPSADTETTVDLGGTFRNRTGAALESITLSPESGAVLSAAS